MDKQQCHKCSGFGHIASRCRVGKNKSVRCNLCGRGGHLRRECPGIDDDGAGQSKNKGKSSVPRGQKKEGKHAAHDDQPALPTSSVSFLDMFCSAVVSPQTLSDAIATKKFGDDFPSASFKGALLGCPLDRLTFTFPLLNYIGDSKLEAVDEDDVNAVSIEDMSNEAIVRSGKSKMRSSSVASAASQSGVDKDCDLAIGFCAGVSPLDAKAFLEYYRMIDKSPSRAEDVTEDGLERVTMAYIALSRALSNIRVLGIGPTGLDFTPSALLQLEAQEECFRLHLEFARTLFLSNLKEISTVTAINADAGGVVVDRSDLAQKIIDEEDDIAAIGLQQIKATSKNKILIINLIPAGEVRSIFDFDRLSIAGGGLDDCLMKILDDTFQSVDECKVPIVFQISSCGIKWTTIQLLMIKFCNCYFSFDCRLTHSKQKLLREYAFDLPLGRIVLGSNAPLYPPSGYSSPEGSHPGHVLVVAQAIAEIKQLELDVILGKCYQNALHLLAC